MTENKVIKTETFLNFQDLTPEVSMVATTNFQEVYKNVPLYKDISYLINSRFTRVKVQLKNTEIRLKLK